MQILRLAVAAGALAFVLTACGSSQDDGSAVQSPSSTEPATSSQPATTAAPTTTSTTAAVSVESTPTSELGVASANAESYKVLAPTVSELSQGVYDFVARLEAARIDQLATAACGEVSPTLNESELGLQGLASYELLQPAEQEAITVEDWFLFYGSILGYFCPENLDQSNLGPSPESGADPMEQFRATISQLEGVSAEADEFTQGLDNAELERLRVLACDPLQANPNTEAFGLAIIDSYQTELSPTEGAQLSLSGYGELYGAIVGWFCPSNLPR